MLLAVNYHYVGMPAFPYPGIWGLSVKDFVVHLEYLKKHFSLVGIPELAKTLRGGGNS